MKIALSRGAVPVFCAAGTASNFRGAPRACRASTGPAEAEFDADHVLGPKKRELQLENAKRYSGQWARRNGLENEGSKPRRAFSRYRVVTGIAQDCASSGGAAGPVSDIRDCVAETEGFEPSVPDLPVRRFSKPLVSATHPRLRIAAARAGYSEGFGGRQGALVRSSQDVDVVVEREERRGGIAEVEVDQAFAAGFQRADRGAAKA